MAGSLSTKRTRANSALLESQKPKRMRIPNAKAAPPPPPAPKAPKPKKSSQMEGKASGKPREESTEVLEVSSGSPSPPPPPPSPPKPTPHLVQIYGVVTIDGKECGTVNNIIDINHEDIFTEKKYDWLAELAWEKIKTYCNKRGGIRESTKPTGKPPLALSVTNSVVILIRVLIRRT